MTGEEMERAFQFLIEHHARISADLDRLEATQERTGAKIESLAESVSRRAAQKKTDRLETRGVVDIMTEEMRDRLNKLILGNEVTLDLTSQVARLIIRPPTLTIPDDRIK